VSLCPFRVRHTKSFRTSPLYFSACFQHNLYATGAPSTMMISYEGGTTQVGAICPFIRSRIFNVSCQYIGTATQAGFASNGACRRVGGPNLPICAQESWRLATRTALGIRHVPKAIRHAPKSSLPLCSGRLLLCVASLQRYCLICEETFR
jgi:hypothetical protein